MWLVTLAMKGRGAAEAVGKCAACSAGEVQCSWVWRESDGEMGIVIKEKNTEDEDVVKQVGNMMHAAMGEFNAKSYDEELLGEVGSVMWEEDTENVDMVKQVENLMQLGTTRG